jgi:flagellin
VQNRLGHTLNSLSTYQENLVSAESRIRDVDMAKEMVEFTKSQILQQAGTSMLSQANQAPQSVLSLLR